MKSTAFGVVLFMCCLQCGKLATADVPDYPNLGPVFTFKHIEAWIPSKETMRKFPYYVSGVDKEGRPVLVVEGGRWNYRKAVEGNSSDYEEMRRQVSKGAWHIVQAVTGNIDKVVPGLQIVNEEELLEGIGFIIDMEGFDYVQSASPRTMLFFFELSRAMSKLTDFIAYAHIINMNFAVETVLNAVKPALGSFADKLEVSGTNKARWTQRLLKLIPRDQLPPWYGGQKGYKPAAVFG